MDPPKHRHYRELLARRFTPRSLRAMEAEVAAIGRGILDELAEQALEGECDFVERIAAPFPLAVIAWMLDVPRADWGQLHGWTNAVVGPADPDYQIQGESAHETRLRASNELYAYFAELAKDRTKGDADDLVAVLARAEVDGAPLTHHELVSYYLLLVAAGNETTRNAISGGLLAFLDLLRTDPVCSPSSTKIAPSPSDLPNPLSSASYIGQPEARVSSHLYPLHEGPPRV